MCVEVSYETLLANAGSRAFLSVGLTRKCTVYRSLFLSVWTPFLCDLAAFAAFLAAVWLGYFLLRSEARVGDWREKERQRCVEQ